MALPCKTDPEQWLDPDSDTPGRPHRDAGEPRKYRELRAALNCVYKCPVRQLCLTRELRWPVEHQWHVYGGYTAGERRTLLRPEVPNPGPPKVTPHSGTWVMLKQFMAGATVEDLMGRFNLSEESVSKYLRYMLRSRRAVEDAELLSALSSDVGETAQPVPAA